MKFEIIKTLQSRYQIEYFKEADLLRVKDLKHNIAPGSVHYGGTTVLGHELKDHKCISYRIMSDYRNLGLTTILVEEFLKLYPDIKIQATIEKSNKASIALAYKAEGLFKLIEDDKYITFVNYKPIRIFKENYLSKLSKKIQSFVKF